MVMVALGGGESISLFIACYLNTSILQYQKDYSSIISAVSDLVQIHPTWRLWRIGRISSVEVALPLSMRVKLIVFTAMNLPKRICTMW